MMGDTVRAESEKYTPHPMSVPSPIHPTQGSVEAVSVTCFYLFRQIHHVVQEEALQHVPTQPPPPPTQVVTELTLKYFDTLPPCTALCVLKTGFLFAGSEFGNHALYQFQGIGDHADDVESSSSTTPPHTLSDLLKRFGRKGIRVGDFTPPFRHTRPILPTRL
jgi:hypothetical protein